MPVTRFVVVPHTHWDREWYAPFEHFRLALGRVVDGVLDTLESDPAFTSFTLDGQAIVLEDYVDARPDHEPRLRAMLATGRLEVGPSYVLPDELLVGGEPLIRNLLLGRAVCRRFGVEPSPAGYLPDSFGHPRQLPQILAGFGIGTFLFSRGLGDELDELGSVFRWQADDGSEVVACQLLPHYDNFASVRGVDDGERRIRAIVDEFTPALERSGVTEVVLGNGSDHLPIQPEMPAWCAELQRRLGDAEVRIGTYGGYAASLQPASGELRAWHGELLGSRLENVLRGVNSARLYIKQANQRAEDRLLAVETYAALRALSGEAPFPAAELTLAWRDLLRNQPHDSICGCSCDEVHRDMLVRYGSLHRTLSDLVGPSPPPTDSVRLFNPLPSRRARVIEVPGTAPIVAELDGFEVGTYTLSAAVPPAPTRAPVPTPAPAPGDHVAIESDRFRVEASPDGTVSLVDLASGESFEGLHRLEDELDMGDLYTFCPVDGDPGWVSDSSARVRVLVDGPPITELELTAHVERPGGSLMVTTVVRLVTGSDRVELRTTLDNGCPDHRLRAVFPVGTGGGPVRAEGQFALVERPLVPAPPRADWAEPPDPTQHTLGAVALGRLAILTRGLPEYEARSAGDGKAELCLTLVRGVGLISQPAGALSTRPRSAGPATPTPEGQSLGRHVLEYALLPGADRLSPAALLRAAHDYRTAFLALPPGEDSEASLRLDGDVVFSCLKGAEDGDGTILRCFNPGAEVVTLTIDGARHVSRCRLDEAPAAADPSTVRPGEIATLRLRD